MECHPVHSPTLCSSFERGTGYSDRLRARPRWPRTAKREDHRSQWTCTIRGSKAPSQGRLPGIMQGPWEISETCHGPTNQGRGGIPAMNHGLFLINRHGVSVRGASGRRGDTPSGSIPLALIRQREVRNERFQYETETRFIVYNLASETRQQETCEFGILASRAGKLFPNGSASPIKKGGGRATIGRNSTQEEVELSALLGRHPVTNVF